MRAKRWEENNVSRRSEDTAVSRRRKFLCTRREVSNNGTCKAINMQINERYQKTLSSSAPEFKVSNRWSNERANSIFASTKSTINQSPRCMHSHSAAYLNTVLPPASSVVYPQRSRISLSRVIESRTTGELVSRLARKSSSFRRSISSQNER